jgi:hypothetical protein
MLPSQIRSWFSRARDRALNASALRSVANATGVSLISARDQQLLDTVKQALLPPSCEAHESYVPQRLVGSNGFSLNHESQLELLRSFQTWALQTLFQRLRDDKQINVGFNGKQYGSQGLIHNGHYPTPDAEIYAAMISASKPSRIIEVGSGYSTAIARATVDHLGLDCQIHVIDPHPRRDIEHVAHRIEDTPVECSSLANTELTDKTLLFIDSSHVCRSGGDLPFLYCRILPGLPAGVLVHIHDVFLPYDYPDNYVERFYTEEYLLHALLANSTKFDVVLAAHWLSRQHPQAMQDTFGPGVARDPLFFGASFWMRSKL